MSKRKKKQPNLISFFNKIALLLLIVGIFGVVYLDASFTRAKYNLEKLNIEYEEQFKKNEALEMKINELASLDKIQMVATKNGFTYNNDNIKTISTR